MPRSLYICYFGVREPLVQTQVVPYLVGIAEAGWETHLLTFEPELGKWTSDELRDQEDLLRGQGIVWHRLKYHKRPTVPATLYDIARGSIHVRRLLAKYRFDILHCRVHVPVTMAMLGRMGMRRRPKVLFDIRGFFPEEYTDAGVWPENGWIYRGVKRVEKWLMDRSDGFVVLTEKARDILFPESRIITVDRLGRPVEVIPCCVDLKQRFAELSTDR